MENSRLVSFSSGWEVISPQGLRNVLGGDGDGGSSSGPQPGSPDPEKPGVPPPTA